MVYSCKDFLQHNRRCPCLSCHSSGFFCRAHASMHVLFVICVEHKTETWRGAYLMPSAQIALDTQANTCICFSARSSRWSCTCEAATLWCATRRCRCRRSSSPVWTQQHSSTPSCSRPTAGAARTSPSWRLARSKGRQRRGWPPPPQDLEVIPFLHGRKMQPGSVHRLQPQKYLDCSVGRHWVTSRKVQTFAVSYWYLHRFLV